MLSRGFLFANNDEYTIDLEACQMKAIIGALHVGNADSLGCLSVTISPSTSRCAHAAPAVKMGCAEACARGDQYYFDEFGQPEAQARPRLGLRDPHHACLLGRSHGQSVPLPEIPVATKPKQSEFIAPFWAVGVTQDISASNMQIENGEIIVCVKVSMMFNTRVIKNGEELLLHQRRGCSSL